MIFAGVDAGSRTVKVVLIDQEKRVLGWGIEDQSVDRAAAAFDLFERTARRAGLDPEDIVGTLATGYGRDALDFADTTVTEITCHARGVLHQMPDVRTVIDIGGQDSKLIRLQEGGEVRDFVMNDRCAAGTGRFLEIVAGQMEMNVQELGRFARQADRPASISSMCVVFAETEILGLLAEGESRENIVSGVQASIASRVASMAGRQIQEPVVFTGGVALVSGMAGALETALGLSVAVAENPQLTGALGGALLVSELETV